MASKWLAAWSSSSPRERRLRCGGADEPAGLLRPLARLAGGSGRGCPRLAGNPGVVGPRAVRAQAAGPGVLSLGSRSCGVGGSFRFSGSNSFA